MGSRRLRPMTAADVVALPGPCATCTFWETRLSGLAASADPVDRAEVKADWAEAVTAHWGYCGVVASQDDQIIGYLTLAPPMYVPRLGAFATTPVSPDAAVVMSGLVLEAHRGKGTGRQLVQAAAGLVARRELRALEAVGTYHEGPSCMLPATWLEAVGFSVVRAHPSTPRLRLDLHSTVRWVPDLGAAWHRLAGLVVQPAPPEPAAYRDSADRMVPGQV